MLRALVPIALLAGACTTNQGDEGMVVVQNSAVGDKCEFLDTNPAFNPRGTLFLDSPVPYLFTPVVESKISATTTQVQEKTIALHGARIDVSIDAFEVVHDDGTISQLTFDATELGTLKTMGATHFKSLFAAPLPPNAGRANVAFDIVPLSLLSAITMKAAATPADHVHVQLVASVSVYGDLAGDEVTSLKFEYPVTVCSDCIVNQLRDAMTGAALDCSMVAAGTAVRPGNACNAFQDGNVDCCTTNGALVCPAPVKAM